MSTSSFKYRVLSGPEEVVPGGAQPGDLLEFTRKEGYAHWGVYLGTGSSIKSMVNKNLGLELNDNELYVGHLTARGGGVDFNIAYDSLFANSNSGACLPPAIVVTPLAVVAAASSVRVAECDEEESTDIDGHEVVRRCLSLVGVEGYNLALRNCEYFATYCRYGTPVSRQVERTATGVLAGVGGAVGMVSGAVGGPAGAVFGAVVGAGVGSLCLDAAASAAMHVRGKFVREPMLNQV